MLKPNFRSSSNTAKERKLPYTPDRVTRGSGLGVSEGVGVTGGGVDVTGAVATLLVDVNKEGVSSMVDDIEPVTLEVEGGVTAGCADVDEISVVSTDTVKVGVTSTEI